MKNAILTTIGCFGALVANWFGGWDMSLITLLIFMGLDYLTGLIVAGVFQKSKKSETGGLNSNIGWKGLIKKCLILVMVFMAAQLDKVINSNVVRDAVCIAFIVNESTSIIENVGLCGVPIPNAIKKAIDILNERGKENDD